MSQKAYFRIITVKVFLEESQMNMIPSEVLCIRRKLSGLVYLKPEALVEGSVAPKSWTKPNSGMVWSIVKQRQLYREEPDNTVLLLGLILLTVMPNHQGKLIF